MVVSLLKLVEIGWTMLNHVEPVQARHTLILTLSVFLCDRPCNQHQSASTFATLWNTCNVKNMKRMKRIQTANLFDILYFILFYTLFASFCLFCSLDCWTARRVSLPRSMAPRSRWSQSQNHLRNEERYRNMIKTYNIYISLLYSYIDKYIYTLIHIYNIYIGTIEVHRDGSKRIMIQDLSR